LYSEGASKLGYTKGACSRMYTRSRNKVVYIEFAGCRRLVLLIAENRSVYILSKVNAVVKCKFIFLDSFIIVEKLVPQVVLILVFPRESLLNFLKLIDYKFKILGARLI
jgi:hypothetical protein